MGVWKSGSTMVDLPQMTEFVNSPAYLPFEQPDIQGSIMLPAYHTMNK
jgi:hypothetical protein